MIPLQHLDITKKILDMCKTAGYTAVCIGTVDEKAVPGSLGWGKGSIVCHGDFKQGNKCEIDGWPAIWDIAGVLRINAGCGNSHQYQITIKEPIGTFMLENDKWQLIGDNNISLENALQLAKIGVLPTT